LFKYVSGLSIVAASGDVFYTLPFYLKTLRTISHFGWGERVVIVSKKKTFLLLLKPFKNKNFLLLLLRW
jgi:hypothetical protein